jgi:hypothetical protein
MKISDNFSFDELTVTNHGILQDANRITAKGFLKQLKYTAGALEECRAVIGSPLKVTSGFRSPTLNKAVGGSPTSKHTQGLAADFVPYGLMSVKEAFDKLIANKDKLYSVRKVIIEGIKGKTWIHMQAKVAKEEKTQFFATADGKNFKEVV